MARKPLSTLQPLLEFPTDSGDMPGRHDQRFLTPKENPMQYKTIVLQLLEQRRRFTTCSERTEDDAPNAGAGFTPVSAKARHETWKELLSQAKPGSAPSQIASEALEIALMELEDRLSRGSPPEESDALSLEAAMAFISRRTPPA